MRGAAIHMFKISIFFFHFLILVLFGHSLKISGKIICFEFRNNCKEQPKDYGLCLPVSIAEDNRVKDSHPGERP